MNQILVADDNKHIREFCKSELEAEGYVVFLARDGREATRVAESQRLDLAILDIRMPTMDGFDAAVRIKAIAPTVPILFFTAHDEAVRNGDRGNTAVARIAKSDDLTELKQAIARLLSVAKADQPAHSDARA